MDQQESPQERVDINLEKGKPIMEAKKNKNQNGREQKHENGTEI